MKQTPNNGGVAAYLINPNARTIEAVTLTQQPNALAEIYSLLDCRLITSAPFSEHDTLYVDDEGLLHGPVYQLFGVRGHGQVLAGKGLLVSIDEDGKDASAGATLAEVRAKVVFIEALFKKLYALAPANNPKAPATVLPLDRLEAHLAEGA